MGGSGRRAVAAGLALWLAASAAGRAEEWRALDGPQIVAALSARVLGYADGRLQDFKADGTTLADGGVGRWRVEADRFCSAWPPAERWACYGVEREARGLDIRFTDTSGHVTVGRYVDLK
jgi:hypothetical protein